MCMYKDRQTDRQAESSTVDGVWDMLCKGADNLLLPLPLYYSTLLEKFIDKMIFSMKINCGVKYLQLTL